METFTNGSSRANGVGYEQEKHRDLEMNPIPSAHLTNNIIQSFRWQGINVNVKDRLTKQPVFILSNADGLVKARVLIAIIGPSGSSKTTLLTSLLTQVCALRVHTL